MRVIFEALGAKVDWDNNTFTAIATKDDLTIKITIDDMKLYKNDQVIELDVPARLIDGRTLVPARAVSEGMGAKVDWDNENWKVIIKTADIPEEPKAYDMGELSTNDKKVLDGYYSQVRYLFEQEALPAFFDAAEGIEQLLLSKDAYVCNAVHNEWNTIWKYLVMEIQMNSEDTYELNMDIVNEEELDKLFDSVVEKYGYESHNYFETSYIKTSGGNTMLLVTFKDNVSEHPITCKYVGITLDKTNKIRYFTSEDNKLIEEDFNFLCEVKYKEGIRGTYFEIPATRNDFLNGIDNVLSSKMNFSLYSEIQ